jgi:hypothetical protein
MADPHDWRRTWDAARWPLGTLAIGLLTVWLLRMLTDG